MKKLFKLPIILVLILTFSSCSFNKPNKATEPTASIKVEAPITLPTIEETIKTLCSDEFGGRLVGTKGNELTGEYIKDYFKKIKLGSLYDNDYCHKYSQEVWASYGDNKGNDPPTTKLIDNIVGVIKGKSSTNAVIISAHYDHIGYQKGKIIRGALDNASGVAALLEIAQTLKTKSLEKLFDIDIIICSFNAEEFGLRGSNAFVKDIKSKYTNLYNINMDCIGAKQGGKISLKNKSKVSDKLYTAMKTSFKKNNIEFSDVSVRGTSDHQSFEYAKIPNIFIAQEAVKPLVHVPTDTPEILDFNEIKKLSNAICDFIETNNGVAF